MPRRQSTIRKVSYVLQVTCDKTPSMNEKEFLESIRERLSVPVGINDKPMLPPIYLDGDRPRVSVMRKVEERVAIPKQPSLGEIKDHG